MSKSKIEWKDIDGFKGRYKVSNCGHILSVPRKVNCNGGNRFVGKRILKQQVSGQGYLRVRLRKPDGKKINLYVHRLVAKAFLANPENKPKVNHKDGVKTNNLSANLEWSTSSENQKHAYKNELQNPVKGEKSGRSKLSENEVLRIKKLLSDSEMTQKEIAKYFGVSRVAVTDINTRKTWGHL